jgi:uncharacterized protein (DUF1810 family)
MTPASPHDPFDLDRFLDAQGPFYPQALAELRAGRKRTHWSWFVLPQLRGLGASPMSVRYGIADLDEARAYLGHPVLGARLRECIEAMLAQPHHDAVAMLGAVDARKLRSCLTLFIEASGAESVLRTALDRFFGGEPDAVTLQRLRSPTVRDDDGGA